MTQAPKLIQLRGQPIAGGALPLICTPLVGRTAEAVQAELAAILPKKPDLIEWRGDFASLRAASRASGIALVASYHNFQATPDAATLVKKFTQAEQLGADVAKLAVMPQGPQDVLTLLAATHTASQSLRLPLISMSMGAYGSLSRMMGWVYGSTVTFAVGQSSSAPGQVPFDELRSVLDAVRRAVSGSRG